MDGPISTRPAAAWAALCSGFAVPGAPCLGALAALSRQPEDTNPVRNLGTKNFGPVGAAGILALGLVASVWQVWRGPVLIGLFLALALFSLRLWLNGRGLGLGAWFLVVAVLVLPLTSFAQSGNVDYFYSLAVLLLLGGIGLLLGLHSSGNSIGWGVILFLCFVIVVTLWTVVSHPEDAFNETPYHLGALTGPFGHRNGLGGFLAFGMVPLFLSPTHGVWHEVARWMLLGVSSLLLVATESLTPVLALGVAVLLVFWRTRSDIAFRSRESSALRFKVLRIVGGAALAAALVLWMGQVRPTLGSRFHIWELVVGKLVDEFPHPPAAKWIASNEVAQELGYDPVHSHNALLGLFLIYGVLPTIVFVVAIVGALVAEPASSVATTIRELRVSQGIFVYMLVHSSVENAFLAGPAGALMVGTILGLTIASRRMGTSVAWREQS